jgi:hypothetical protein
MNAGGNAQYAAHSKSIRNSAMNSKLFVICPIRKSSQLASAMGIISLGRVRAASGPGSIIAKLSGEGRDCDKGHR